MIYIARKMTANCRLDVSMTGVVVLPNIVWISSHTLVVKTAFIGKSSTRCIATVDRNTNPSSSQIMRGENGNSVNDQASTLRGRIYLLSGLTPETVYYVYCAQLSVIAPMTIQTMPVSHNKMHVAITSIKGTEVILGTRFSRTSEYKCAIVSHGSVGVDDSNLFDETAPGYISNTLNGGSSVTEGVVVTTTHTLLMPGTTYDAYCAQSGTISDPLMFTTMGIEENAKVLTRENGPFFSITFSHDGPARCVALENDAEAPSNAAAVLDNTGIIVQGTLPAKLEAIGGIPYLTKYAGLVYNVHYDIYCAQSDILSPKLDFWNGEIISPTRITQIEWNRILIKTAFAGAGNARCVVLPKNAVAPTPSEVMAGTNTNIVGIPPLQTNAVGGTSFDVVYYDLMAGVDYKAYCSQEGEIINEKSFVLFTNISKQIKLLFPIALVMQ